MEDKISNSISSFKKGFAPWNKGMKGYHIKKRRIEECLTCKESFYPRHTEQKYCSWKCYKPGNKTLLNHLIRSHPKYIQWRNSVLQRDNYTCGLCGNYGGKLVAHHLTPFNIIKKRFDIKTIENSLACDFLWQISNGVTLCKECHKKTIHSSLNYEKLDENDYQLESQVRLINSTIEKNNIEINNLKTFINNYAY